MGDDNKLPFDMNEFLKRHLTVKNWMNYREQSYTKSELLQLAELATAQFRIDDSSLAVISPPVTVVGDIHGQYVDLVRLLSSRASKDATVKGLPGFAATRYCFLGDYVDRGNHSVECISLVFALKIVYPNHYVLLRGNHETRAINFAYGFREELVNKLGTTDGNDVWEAFNDAFSYMPLACLIGGRILCMHGGISPVLKSLDDIKKIKRPLVDVGTNQLAQDLLWADPVDHHTVVTCSDVPSYSKNVIRGLSVSFNDAAIIDTCKRLNLKMIIRAHQMIPEGFKFYADKKLITIFSAPRYLSETDNHGATLKIDKNGRVTIMKMVHKKQFQGVPVPDELTRGDDLTSSATTAKKKKPPLSGSTSKSVSSTQSENSKTKSSQNQK